VSATREQKARERWDRMTPGERCLELVKAIDKNTRAIAKVGSAIWYLCSDEQDLELDRKCGARDVGEFAPDLHVAMRSLLRQRRTMRKALETNLAEQNKLKAAREALQVGRVSR